MNDSAMTVITTAMWLMLPVLETVGVTAAPWATDRYEMFGVTVPPAAFSDIRLAGLRRNYSLTVGGFGGILALVDFGVWLGFGPTVAFWTAVIALVLIMAFGFVWWQRCRREMISVKTERGWKATGDRRVAVIDDSLPKPLPLWWDLVYVAIIAATVIVGYAGYDSMPQRVPMHMNMAGVVDGWADKSPWLIWLAPGFELAIVTVMVLGHIAILYSGRLIDPHRPPRSVWRHAAIMRVWSVYTLLVGIAVMLGVGLTLQLGMLGMVPLGLMGTTGMFVAMLAFAGCIVVILFYGRNGSHADDVEVGETGTEDETMP
ncbi:hypothetical protein CS006_06740 [Bifidobacterium primatium]|uniref:DUF1648 domain-containing protein n=2 Tax=Bifidobacterium primatium TaxID=2045438 RepID=A0A2M9H808_9BIFI|nr:hypothetical protein CS006_06740 [Bifidobacterium primatium]